MAEVLLVDPLVEGLRRRLTKQFRTTSLDVSQEGWTDELDRPDLREPTVVVTSSKTGLPSMVVRHLTQIRAIVNYGVGYDKIDMCLADSRGIIVSNTPDVLVACVADAAVGMCLSIVRRFAEADRFVRGGRWLLGPAFGLGRRFSGMRVGILGLGQIGMAISDRLAGFECEISYHNRNRVAGSTFRYVDSPLALASWSDLLIVSCSGGEDTLHLVDAAVLEALGPDGYLVNVARGSVVDENALVRSLVSGRIGGAALDVFGAEPCVPNEVLMLENVLLLPHIGSGTIETREAMADVVLENVESYLRRGKLRTPVTA